MKFEFTNLKNRFHKRQVSFLVVKTCRCKLGIRQKWLDLGKIKILHYQTHSISYGYIVERNCLMHHKIYNANQLVKYRYNTVS